MTLPGAEATLAALSATWPPAEVRHLGPFLIRKGQGGGARVSAARALGPATPEDIAAAAEAMRALGQEVLFQVMTDEAALDADLAALGYTLRDPVAVLAVPVAALARRPMPPQTLFECWPPMAMQMELWAAAGIGPARIAVMECVPDPRTALLGRLGESPAGTAFVVLRDGIAVLNALVVAPGHRRRGLAGHLVAGAADWAQGQGAEALVVAVARANAPALALYARLGMVEVAGYHCRGHDGRAGADCG